MPYKTDDHGLYRRTARWVRTWGGRYAGWAIDELREYQDGTARAVLGEPHYIRHSDPVKSEPDMQEIWQVYRIAAAALGAPEE